MKTNWYGLTVLVVALSLLAACSGGGAAPTAGPNGTVKLILGAYTTPREAYGEIIPLFQAKWKAETGQDVTFEESYLGSGAQSRAVVEGFEADVVALSLEADIKRIEDAGLITHDWKSAGHDGMVSTSIAVIGVRAGNPQGITDWVDLAKPDLEVLTPNPETSGGAMWNILALYGAALRGHVAGVPAGDQAAAQQFLQNVLANVTVMDKGARESITNFETGVGDAIITYENEILVGQQSGQDYEMVRPASTIRIDNPAAVVDTYVDQHGTRAAAEAFVAFLFTPEAQAVFARHGLRAVDESVAAATASQYPPVADLFTITDLGGWDRVGTEIFGEGGVYPNAIAGAQSQ
jgi:sulfate/thiosulfate transport system substrate-binding protein